VAMGEPIAFRVTVNGPPPLSLVPLLDLAAQPALAERFRVPREPSLPTFTPVGAMFSNTIRVRSTGRDVAAKAQIPPVELNYFDTSSGGYKVARSEPINITVRPSTVVDLGDNEAESGLLTLERGPSARVDRSALALDAGRFDLSATLRSPLTIASIAAPPLLLGIAAAGLTMRRRALVDPDRRRRRRAVRTARTRLARSSAKRDPAQLASRTLTELAADWFARAPGTLTAAEATSLLTRDADPTFGELARLLAACDEVRFGSPRARADQPSANLLDHARAVLGRVAVKLEGRA